MQQYKENLTTQLDPIYTKIREIDTQFSMDDANMEHYKLPPFAKPQIQPTDEEIKKEHISTLMKTFDAEAENIKQQMRATMRANGQAESSTDDNRSSTGSYKGKSSKTGKQTTYCSACGEPDQNASKCKKKHTLFCDFCNTHNKCLQTQNEQTKHLHTLQIRPWQ